MIRLFGTQCSRPNFAFALLVSASVGFMPGMASAASSRLQSLLDATPEGGWVKASTTTFSSAWPTGDVAVPYSSYKNPASVVIAWSSFAWDSTSSDLMLWGGGHANYAGNEMYVWDGLTGAWGRGSLPSRLDSNYFVVDNAAPQSSHTYDNQVYLPVNNMFLTFGGAAFQSGGNTSSANGREGPWLWDPAKADPNKVGGTTGSGYNLTTPGGQMWTNRQGQWTGVEAPGYSNGTTAYRTENGKDVVYLTADSNASGFPSLYRYTLGDVKNGGTDTWEKIGVMWNSAAYKGAATIDTANQLYIRSALGGSRGDFAVWDLDQSNATNPGSNRDIKVDLQFADGTAFEISGDYGVEYDLVNGNILLWDGANKGKVWRVDVSKDESGNVESIWRVTELSSTTAAQPGGSFVTGVLGKWKYASELGAFVALNEFSGSTGDAEVWLYKPFAAAVPEPSTYAMMIAGLGLLAWVAGRRRVRVSIH